jgi:hypothetical protein
MKTPRGNFDKTGFSLVRIRDHFGVARSLRVLVDGEDVGELFYWEHKHFGCKPGSHSVQVEMDWCRSEELLIEVQPGETIELECGSAFRGLLLWWVGLVAAFVAPGRVFIVRRARGGLVLTRWERVASEVYCYTWVVGVPASLAWALVWWLS